MALAHNPRIVTDGLVLALDAANPKSYPGTGTTWSDLSGNGNDGTLVNGVGYSADNKGNFTFDAANDYVTISNSTSLNITGDNITLEVICKATVLASSLHGDGVISKGSGSNDGQYEIMLLPVGSQNKAFFRCYTMGSYSPGSILMDLNQPYMITCVLDNKYMRIYINGEQDDSGVLKSGSIVSRTQPVTLGTRQLQSGSSTSAFGGSIYAAKVYNRALTESEIKQNFNATRGRYGI